MDINKFYIERKRIIEEGLERGFRDKSIEEEDCNIIISLVKDKGYKTAIEIGTWTGVSALLLVKMGMKVYTCDKNNAYNLKHNNIKYYNVLSTPFLKKLNKKDIKADLLFLDAGIRDWDIKNIKKIMKNGALVITHDYIDNEKGVRNFKKLKKHLTKITVIKEMAYTWIKK